MDATDNAPRRAIGVPIDKDTQRMWRAALRFSAVGLEMGVAVAAGFLIGNWIDGRYGTKPYWTLGMLLLGIATAFRGLIRVAMEAKRDAEREENAAKDDEP